MSPNKRIFLNVIATYGRSVFALVVGLFTARWVLMALGEIGFGLYGVVGGLTSFVIFVNELLAMSVARFFAVSVGASLKSGNELQGIEDSRKWFNTALLIHSVIPVLLVLVGYPIGEWMVRCFLSVPPDRISACVWVWRFCCLSCFVGMVNVPFRAMYTAKQEIAELTVYSFATTTITAVILYYMVCHPADWLFDYALWMCVLSVVPNLMIAGRAVMKYPECRVVRSYLWSGDRLKTISAFAAARFFTSFSDIVVAQGQQLLVNKYLGPSCNAAMRVGNSVASQTSTLAGSLSGAFWPAIANAVGEGKIERVREMSFRVCRLSTFLISIFAIPLALESDEVLVLWLKEPPAFSSVICVAVLIGMVINRLTEGYWMAVMGLGERIPFYSWWVSWSGFIGFGVTWGLLAGSLGMMSICYAIVLCSIITLGIRLWLGSVIARLSAVIWLRTVLVPLSILIAVATLVGASAQFWIEPSFIRVGITTALCEMVLIPLAWFFVLAPAEREYVGARIKKVVEVFGWK